MIDDQSEMAGRFGEPCKEHTGLGRNPSTLAWEPDLSLIKCMTGQVISPFEPVSEVKQGILLSSAPHPSSMNPGEG